MNGGRTNGRRTPAADSRRLLRNVLGFRLGVIGAILVAASLAYLPDWEWDALLPWIWLATATLAFTLASWMALRRDPLPGTLAWLQPCADLAVAAAVCAHSGGFASQFAFLYVLPVLSGAALRAGWGALLGGTAAAGVYGALAVASFGSGRGDISQLPALLHVLLQVTFLHASAVFAAVVAERARRHGEELRAVGRQLHEERINTDTIVQSMQSGLLTVDRAGTVSLLNRAAERILGWHAEEAMGRSAGGLLSGICPAFAEGLRAALERGEMPHRLEAVVQSPGRDPCPIGVSLSVLRTAEGETRGAAAIFQDLTEVKRMEERMRQSDRLAAVGELAGAIAHEIRNPLSTITGSVELLARELPQPGPRVRRLLELMLREAERLQQITNDFLAYGKLKPKEVKRVKVQELVRELGALVQTHEAYGKHIGFNVELPPRAVHALWDGPQVLQALLNIGVNALQAMPGGGSLALHVSVVPWEQPCGRSGALHPLPRAVRFAFEDTGPGIPADAIHRVFEPFFTTKTGGTGLGLSIVARIVEDHGGLLDIQSHGGEGTLFRVTLPGVCAADEDAQEAAHEEENVLALAR